MFHSADIHSALSYLKSGSVALIWREKVQCLSGGRDKHFSQASNMHPRVSSEDKQPIHHIAVGNKILALNVCGVSVLWGLHTNIFIWSFYSLYSLNFCPSLNCPKRCTKKDLIPLWSTQTKGMKPCWNHYWTCTLSTVFLSLLQVRAEVKPQRILEISGRRNVCVPCCFPSRGVFSRSPGCMEVPAPGLLHIKATCLCFSFLQACHTCSSHTCTRRCCKVKTSRLHTGDCRDFTRCGFTHIYSHVKTFWNMYDDSEKVR